MYVYEGHHGEIYTSEYRIPYDELYCETCGDSDWEVGNFNSAIDVLKYMADDISVDGSGGWDIDHVLSVLICFEDCPSKERAISIVRSNRRQL